jgi:hypothetical protein
MWQGVLDRQRRLVLFCILLAGCGRGPRDIKAPEWNPAAAAERALSDYDADGDHKLARQELKNCPGLLSALALFDRDSDGAISSDELKAKLQEIHEQQTALVEVSCSVMKGGRPLEGATVTFVPETFMGDAFKPSSGVSRPDGTAFPTVAEEELPKELRGRVHGVHCGIFRVTVTHPTVAVPAKYNTQTELGWVVMVRSHDTLAINL